MEGYTQPSRCRWATHSPPSVWPQESWLFLRQGAACSLLSTVLTIRNTLVPVVPSECGLLLSLGRRVSRGSSLTSLLTAEKTWDVRFGSQSLSEEGPGCGKVRCSPLKSTVFLLWSHDHASSSWDMDTGRCYSVYCSWIYMPTWLTW